MNLRRWCWRIFIGASIYFAFAALIHVFTDYDRLLVNAFITWLVSFGILIASHLAKWDEQ